VDPPSRDFFPFAQEIDGGGGGGGRMSQQAETEGKGGRGRKITQGKPRDRLLSGPWVRSSPRMAVLGVAPGGRGSSVLPRPRIAGGTHPLKRTHHDFRWRD